ncbi:MAG: NTPase [Candidatus Bathyarchaeota archaeon]|nr:NTPase [Candidatus Bathyarchaeota archaeon]
MQKRIFLLTGSPGVGKTTALLRVIDKLKAEGYSVGGMVSREVRQGGIRVGFEILDLTGNRRGWLAHISQNSGPQVGKYRVNLNDLEDVGVQAIMTAIKRCNIIVVDEIGPMELFSEKFRIAVKDAIESGKPLIGVVHWKAKDDLIKSIKGRNDVEILSLTFQNRDAVPNIVLEKLENFLNKHSSVKA